MNMVEWRPETWNIIRELYYSWERGNINATEICDALAHSDVNVHQSFQQFLEQHSHARDVSFTVFMKYLKRSPDYLTPRQPNSEQLTNSTPRRQHILTFRDIPLSSSAKAPFGTDDNVYIRGFQTSGTDDPACVSVLRDDISEPRKTYASVPTANDVFKQSGHTEAHMLDSRIDIPRHLIASINPITGEEPQSDNASDRSPTVSSERKQLENRSYITADATGLVSATCEDSSSGQRRHFAHFNKESSTTLDNTFSTESVFLSDENIISHDTSRPVEPYRPRSRINQSMLRSCCPFATDKDDLTRLRNELHSTPLGKPYIPPVPATYTN